MKMRCRGDPKISILKTLFKKELISKGGIRLRKRLAIFVLFAFMFSMFPVLPTVAANITGLDVTVPQNTIAIEQPIQAKAILQYDDGSSWGVNNDVTWQSQDESIATVTNTGLITGISGGITFIDAIYTAADSSIYSDQVQITVDPSLDYYIISPNNKISCLVGQTIPIAATKNDGTTSSAYITNMSITDQRWYFENDSSWGLRNKELGDPDVVTINPDKSIHINCIGIADIKITFLNGDNKTLEIDSHGVNYKNLELRPNFGPLVAYVNNDQVGYQNPPSYVEDSFFGLKNCKFTVDPTRENAPWTKLTNPTGANKPNEGAWVMGTTTTFGVKETYQWKSKGLGHGTINMWFESEPGSTVIVPGSVTSNLIGKNTSNCPDWYVTITLPIGDPHRARLVVELTDENGLQFRGYIPFWVAAYPRPEVIGDIWDLSKMIYHLDGITPATVTDIKSGTPVKLRWQNFYCNSNKYEDSTIRVPAPNVPIEWAAELTGFDNDMNFITLSGGTFTGVDENGINQVNQPTIRTKSGADGWSEVIFNPPVNTLKYASLKISSNQSWPDTWKLIMSTTGQVTPSINILYDTAPAPPVVPPAPPVTPPTPPGPGGSDPTPSDPVIPEPAPEPEPQPEPEPEPPVIIPTPEPKQQPTPEPQPVIIPESTPVVTPKKPEPKKIIKEIPVKKPVITGTVKGIVKMRDGKPLANARLELHSKPRVTFTDSKGYFEFRDVPLGDHKLYLADLRITDEKILIKTLKVTTTENDKYIPISKTVKDLETAQVTLTEANPEKEVDMTVDFELPQPEPEKKTPIWPWLLLLLLLLLILRRRRKLKQEEKQE